MTSETGTSWHWLNRQSLRQRWSLKTKRRKMQGERWIDRFWILKRHIWKFSCKSRKNMKPEPHSFTVSIERRGRGQERCLVGAQICIKYSHAALWWAYKASDKQPNIPEGGKTPAKHEESHCDVQVAPDSITTVRTESNMSWTDTHLIHVSKNISGDSTAGAKAASQEFVVNQYGLVGTQGRRAVPD